MTLSDSISLKISPWSVTESQSTIHTHRASNATDSISITHPLRQWRSQDSKVGYSHFRKKEQLNSKKVRNMSVLIIVNQGNKGTSCRWQCLDAKCRRPPPLVDAKSGHTLECARTRSKIVKTISTSSLSAQTGQTGYADRCSRETAKT